MTKIPKIYLTRLLSRCVRAKQLPHNTDEFNFTKPCLLWQGAVDQKGYGVFRVRPHDMGVPSGIVRVHRLVFWIKVGPFPIACEIDHRCRQRSCVEEEHLQLLGPSEHARLSNLDKRLDAASKLTVLAPASETDEVL